MSDLRKSYKIAGATKIPVSQNLTRNGTKTGDFDMAIDASAVPVEFFIVPLDDYDVVINDLMLLVSDNGSPTILEYGNLGAPLANGLKFFIEREGVKQYSETILKSNSDIVRTGSQFDVTQWQSSVRVVTYKKIYNEFAEGIRLRHRSNDKLGVELNDDCSTLLHHSMAIEGYRQLADAS